MKTSHDAAIAVRDQRYADAAVIYESLASHASLLRRKPQAAFYMKLANENHEISRRIDTGH